VADESFSAFWGPPRHSTNVNKSIVDFSTVLTYQHFNHAMSKEKQVNSLQSKQPCAYIKQAIYENQELVKTSNM
jgi:hypothetical protein